MRGDTLVAPRARSRGGRLLTQAWRLAGRGMNPQLATGLIVLLLFLLIGFVLPRFAPSDPAVWNKLPRDLPPRSTVHSYLQRWDWDGTLEAVHHQLYVACRERAGKEASPTAAILDSKSVKAAEKGGRRPTRSVTTRARRSRGSSTTSSSTRWGCC